ncbi:hypothetical protein [Vibrio owensii]|uniref:hypothetical protein n=1 Tax=Vibrio owensii TaxID=696485 RepID=UPI0018F10C2B|nr:hypothetical protein [Vibrio owensii]
MPYLLQLTHHAIGTPHVNTVTHTLHGCPDSANNQAFERHLIAFKKHNLAEIINETQPGLISEEGINNPDVAIAEIRIASQHFSTNHLMSTINTALESKGFTIRAEICEMPSFTLLEATQNEMYDALEINGEMIQDTYIETCTELNTTNINATATIGHKKTEYHFTHEDLVNASYDSAGKHWVVNGHRVKPIKTRVL